MIKGLFKRLGNIFSKIKYDITPKTYGRFVMNRWQTSAVKYLINANNLKFQVVSAGVYIDENDQGCIIIYGEIRNVLKFIHDMRINFRIEAFHEYIDVEHIQVVK